MSSVGDRLARERARRPWLDHLAVAGERYQSDNGNHLAAAITYFSVLALFPLLLLGLSVAGFVLSGHPHLLDDLHRHINQSVPGGSSGAIGRSVDGAISARGAVGIVGLIGVAYSGLGWIANLRTAVQALWGHRPPKQNFFLAKWRDLLVLIGLGLALLVSLALTAAGTAATDLLIRETHLSGTPGIGVFARVIGIAVAVGADVLIFAWMLGRLPYRQVRMRAVIKGAIFAAIGFEVLKIFGTYYITRAGKSLTAGVLAGLIGLFVWTNLVSRFLLFVTAWTATDPARAESPAPRASVVHGAPSQDSAPSQESAPSPEPPGVPSGAVIAAGLLGIGVASGMAVQAIRRRRDDPG
ncbi:MAG: inner membrane protein YhjD [Pseudonocardiales bacterium]|nr:MAG: inner membrane protein YhjD [Pseudonocardiales bacterium]